MEPAVISKVWHHLTKIYKTGVYRPPELIRSPQIIRPFNYRYCVENLLMAEMLVGGVDREQLKNQSAKALENIFSIQ